MNISLILRRVVGLLCVIFISSCKENQDTSNTLFSQNTTISQNDNIISEQYIVKFKAGVTPSGRRGASTYNLAIKEMAAFSNSFLTTNKINTGRLLYSYKGLLDGFTATMSSADAEKLRKNPNVESVSPDHRIALSVPEVTTMASSNPQISTQNVSWSVRRIGGSTDATGKVVYILDTGVDLNHPDLNVDKTLSMSFVDDEPSVNDEHGHGTHVAGIIAAKNNNFGVAGVASNATIVAVKVINKYGGGSDSGVIAGLSYIAQLANPGDVVNLSIGGVPSVILDDAVRELATTGVYICLAAGNDGRNAVNTSPARVNAANIFTVSACDINDNLAPFSNFGSPPVDYAEPGVKILSCYKNGQYATMSGTSMASPHLAGILVVTKGYIRSGGALKYDRDGIPDIIGRR
jgi:subtilisin family serine protease